MGFWPKQSCTCPPSVLGEKVAEARLIEAEGDDLIDILCTERGVPHRRGQRLKGQVALADWLLAIVNDDAEHYLVLRMGGRLTPGVAVRFLTGEAQPDDEIAEQLAVATGGAVLPPMWAHYSQTPVAQRPSARGVRATDPIPVTRDRSPAFVAGEDGAPTILLSEAELFFISDRSVVRMPRAAIATFHQSLGLLLSEGGAVG